MVLVAARGSIVPVPAMVTACDGMTPPAVSVSVPPLRKMPPVPSCPVRAEGQGALVDVGAAVL